mmetsp:Transcript_124987/g.365059  ORF Transcript_124987/g.365059 Transcript_124987/m.365059 type:complete len:683 (+) Transcript_124987:125-2173(+)
MADDGHPAATNRVRFTAQQPDIAIRRQPHLDADQLSSLNAGDEILASEVFIEHGIEWVKLAKGSSATRVNGTTTKVSLNLREDGFVPTVDPSMGTLLRKHTQVMVEEKKEAGVLTKKEIAEILDRSSDPNMMLPLESKYWTKQQLEMFVMSGGSIRPAWCSIPDERLMANTNMTKEEIMGAVMQAADWITNADAILIGSGAGMGVDSGLGTFRGNQKGVWAGLDAVGLAYEEICQPKWFAEEPHLGWGFWNFCHEAYQATTPHEGYVRAREWGQRCPLGFFSFTSNIDAHWARSGWREDRILECHGALRWLQCSVPCSEDIWDTPEDLDLTEDPRTHRAIGDLPICPKCGAVARPCVLMFGGDAGFSRQGRRRQEWFYNDWVERIKGCSWLCPDPPGPTFVCLELGCGVTVPTVRAELQRVMEDLPCARLIRVNPENPGFSRTLKGRAVSLPLGAIEALTRIDALLQDDELGRFIVHDNFGNGSEIEVPRSRECHQILRKVLFENSWVPDENCDLLPSANNIYQRQKVVMLGWQDVIPEDFFLSVDGPEELPAVCMPCHQGHFAAKSASLEARFAKIFHLLVDLIETFKAESYQKRLETVQDRVTLREMIREVHLEVLPRHGYQVSEGTKPAQWMAVQQRMQAFIQSGDWWSELRKWADASQEVSGGWKMHSLPPSLKQKAK